MPSGTSTFSAAGLLALACSGGTGWAFEQGYSGGPGCAAAQETADPGQSSRERRAVRLRKAGAGVLRHAGLPQPGMVPGQVGSRHRTVPRFHVLRTHPAARVFYSPEVIAWLQGGRKGKIADGAIVIKEQYRPPAAIYRNNSDDNIGCPNDWTYMIKNSAASQDGWFWGEVWYPVGGGAGMNFTDTYQYPNAGFGLYCLRCHASAASEYTFSDPRNIKGTHEWPLTAARKVQSRFGADVGAAHFHGRYDRRFQRKSAAHRIIRRRPVSAAL
jgi:hypothetical protein